MQRQKWTKQEEQELLKLSNEGFSDYEIAEKLHRSYSSVNVKLTRLKKTGAVKSSVVPQSTYPIFDNPITTEGDAVIFTDFEAPFQHSDFVNRCLDLADTWRIDTIHFAGDLLHYDSLSKWGSEWVESRQDLAELMIDIMEELTQKQRNKMREKLDNSGVFSDGSLSAELAESRSIFRSFGSFKKKVVALGNHDDRYLRALDKALSPSELLHQMDVSKDPTWQIAPYYYSLIETEKGTFRATHPRSAAKSAAIDLAVQFHQDVIMGHSHRWAVQRDPSGDFWAIQTGHLVDEKRLAYVMQRDAKRDAHVLGCTIIRDGFPFVLCPETPFEIMKRM